MTIAPEKGPSLPEIFRALEAHAATWAALDLPHYVARQIRGVSQDSAAHAAWLTESWAKRNPQPPSERERLLARVAELEAEVRRERRERAQAEDAARALRRSARERESNLKARINYLEERVQELAAVAFEDVLGVHLRGVVEASGACDQRLFAALRDEVAQVWPEAGDLPETAWAAQVIAEAINRLAKCHDDGWYEAKPAAFALAARMGAAHGWDRTEGTFVVYTREAGTTRAHDPDGVIDALLPDARDVPWPFPYCGFYRQDEARELVASPERRAAVAALTCPDVLSAGGVFDHPSRFRRRAGLSVRCERSGPLP